MLAQNFKTPADLFISDVEFDALIKALGVLERGEAPKESFTMTRVWHEDCGTPACICGWAHYVSGGRAFPLHNRPGGYKIMEPVWDVMPQQLLKLFAYSGHAQRGTENATTEQAAIALRNYLTHGAPRWDEALAG